MFEELQRKERGKRREEKGQRERAKVVAEQSKGGATEIDASQKTEFQWALYGCQLYGVITFGSWNIFIFSINDVIIILLFSIYQTCNRPGVSVN